MSDLIVIAIVQAKPGYEAALVAAQADLVQIVRRLPGCIQYELNESLEKPGSVVFVERWRDHSAWDSHRRGPHMDEFRNRTSPMTESTRILQMKQVA